MTKRPYRIQVPDAIPPTEKFKTLRAAVRRSNELYAEGYTRLGITDRDGEPVEIDYSAPEYKTREELNGELKTTRVARDGAIASAKRLKEAARQSDRELIAAGYIPIDALRPFLTQMREEHHGEFGFGGPASEFTLTFYAPEAGHPFYTAISKLGDHNA